MTDNYIIYEIICNDTNIKLNYIGSTRAYRQRKTEHKKACNNENHSKHNLQVYKIIRENGGWENFTMRPLEEIACNTKIQATIREQYWIDLKTPNMNIYNAHLTEEQKQNRHKEYYAENKDKRKEYYEENKERLNQQRREHYEANKEMINEKHRNYYYKNRDKILDQKKDYYNISKA
jgi:hypothetical protein